MNVLPLLVLAVLLAGCAGGARPARDLPDSALGLYRGSFGSALSADPADDLNYNACDPATERCLGGDEPLTDVLLELTRGADGRVRLAFYRSADDRERGRELDLLGRGCSTRIGASTDWAPGSDGSTGSGSFPLSAGNRLCLNKLRPTTDHALRVESGVDPDSGVEYVHVLVDRDVRSTNYLYVEEAGKRRRVRIDLDNTLDTATDTRYRVCIEDDLGEYTRCVMTDRTLRRFVLPLPVPGGAALSYTWWYELTPRLKRTRGLYEVEQYSGRFERTSLTP